MNNFTRRTLVNGATAIAAGGALNGPALLGWASAWAQAAPWKPERGAQLSFLRWKYFVQAEDEEFTAALDAFTRATGVKISLIRESNDDVQPKASVAVNIGTGPDVFWAFIHCPTCFQTSAST